MAKVELPEIPREDAVHLPSQVTAMIVVDMQNDFAHPEGTLFGEDAARAIPVIAGLLERARAKGVPVVFTQDWHGEGDPEFAIWGEHAKAGTWGSRIVEGLSASAEDAFIRKLRYDAFYGTSLDHLLRVWGVKHLVVVGTVANICVLHTAGSAALRYYEVVVPEDGVAALTPFDKASALRQVTFLYRGRVTRAAGVHFE
jgi:nicotinamidase-related amidase